jgi:putative flippase GtrA
MNARHAQQVETFGVATMIDLSQRDGTAVRELVTQVAWFALVGLVSTGVTFALYGGLRLFVVPVVATLLANAVGTIVGAELNCKVTFAGATTSGKRMAVQNVVSWAWSSGATSIGLVVLDAMVTQLTHLEENVSSRRLTESTVRATEMDLRAGPVRRHR